MKYRITNTQNRQFNFLAIDNDGNTFDVSLMPHQTVELDFTLSRGTSIYERKGLIKIEKVVEQEQNSLKSNSSVSTPMENILSLPISEIKHIFKQKNVEKRVYEINPEVLPEAEQEKFVKDLEKKLKSLSGSTPASSVKQKPKAKKKAPAKKKAKPRKKNEL